MASLREAINRYVRWLEARAQRFRLFAGVLGAVSHRLRHILDNTDDPAIEIQFATRDGRTYELLEDLDDVPFGTTVYTRTVVYGPWKELW